jgi:hypothetical protein
MPSVVCVIQKDIEIGAIEKEMVAKSGGGTRYFTSPTSQVVPYGNLKAGTKVQLRHGFGDEEQRVYIACREGSGWFITQNQNGYSLLEVFKAVRKERSPWEALY